MTYSYTPLSSSYFRLLVLEPYTNDSLLDSCVRCRLISVKFSTVDYQALSYCWGEDGKKKDILIRDKVMRIGENLWSALDHLRRSRFESSGKGPNHWSSRCLWIDAICINQNDIQERNLQVSRMSEIYRKALRVIIWLGPAYSTSELAMTTLNSIDGFSMRRGASSSTSLGEGEVGEALVALVNRPYFMRMWIVQEIILARQIIMYCGYRSVLWSKLSILLDCIKDPDLFRNVSYETASKINDSLAMDLHQNRKKWQERKTSLEELLSSYPQSQCRDPRDKVYSLLGIAADCQNGELKADYNKSLGTVYQDVIRIWTNQKAPGNNISQRIVQLSELLHISFGPALELQSEILNARQLFPIAGCWRGTVSRIGPQFGEIDADGIMPTLGLVDGDDLFKSYQQLSRPIRGLEDLWFLLRRPLRSEENDSYAIINYRKPSDQAVYMSRSLRHSLSNASRRWKFKATRSFAPSATTDDPARPFYFFELSTGYIGISPLYPQYDDIICTFTASTVALLLRKSTVANHYDVMAKVILFARPRDESRQSSDNCRDWLKLILNVDLHRETESCLMDALHAEIALWLESATLKRFTSYPY